MSVKRLIQMRNQGVLPNSVVTAAALRPLYTTINRTLKNIDQMTFTQVREIIRKSSEEVEKFKTLANLPVSIPLYGANG